MFKRRHTCCLILRAADESSDVGGRTEPQTGLDEISEAQKDGLNTHVLVAACVNQNSVR